MPPPFPATQFPGKPVAGPTFARPAQQQAAPAFAQPAAAIPAPRFRAQSPDEPVSNELRTSPSPRPVALAMPSPEQLGIAAANAPTGALDWTAANRRLALLGAISSHRERLPQGGFRFVCLLPTTQADRTHRIEAVATTEAEAVRVALQKAEEWAAGERR